MPFTPSFPRYLATKKTVDDRALNAQVWQAMAQAAAPLADLHVLEVGAGIGTMVERWQERGFGMLGSSVFVANPPHTLHGSLLPLLPWLAETLAQFDGATHRLEHGAGA